jgi:NNP family nitrate/nitrite transporter-like MFS transporter
MLFAPPLAKLYGWQLVYGLSAIPLVVAMIALHIFAKEPPDREQKKLGDYLKVLVDRDAWVFNLLYMITFGGYIGLTSFLPTLFHDQYGIPKESVGQYSAIIVIMASILRVLGGLIADVVGGVRTLLVLCGITLVSILAIATIPSQPWTMVALMVVCFSAMGAGNGAVFQLVPLRFKSTTAVAGSLIGEVGALGGGLLPVAMGLSYQYTGSFSLGFLSGAALSLLGLIAIGVMMREWTSTWVGAGGKAIADSAPAESLSMPAGEAMPSPVMAEG